MTSSTPKPTSPASPSASDDETEGCGYSWDHTIPEGGNVCTECGAEFWDDDD